MSPAIAEQQTPQPEAIPESLKTALQHLISNEIKSDIEREKIQQYSQARKHEQYWRGVQYLRPQTQNGVVMDWTPTGNIRATGDISEQRNQYDYVINNFRGDGRKFVAVLGQRSPNVKARPDRDDNELLTRRSRKADKAAAFLRSVWNVEGKHRKLMLSLWKNGTTFGYTSWVTNKDKYGTISEPVVEWKDVPVGEGQFRCIQCGTYTPESQAQGMCPACGAQLLEEDYMPPEMMPAPEVVDVTEYDGGCVELRLCSILTVTTPFYVEDLTECPWLWHEHEEHKGAIIAAHPELEPMRDDEGEDASAATIQGRQTRDQASSPNGTLTTGRKNRWSYARFWLRPSMYVLVREQNLRKQLAESFPSGLKITMVQGKVVRLEEERLDDVWSMCKPETSEYIYADPIGKDYMAGQDILNDLVNIGIEMWERAIPATAVDPRIFDLKKLREHSGLPGEFIPTLPGVGAQLKDAMFKLPVAEPNPMMMAYGTDIIAKTRETVGILPAIFGAEVGSQTATEAEQKRTQALMQLNTTWNEARDFWRTTYRNGVMQLAKYAAAEITFNGARLTEDEIADLRELLEGGWHFEAEESMPMTWSQRRSLFWDIVKGGPDVWSLLGADHPLNAAYIQENLAMTGWKTPYLAARDKVLDAIRLLLAGTPVPVDEWEDDHAFTVQVVREWCQDEEARRERDRNPMGYKAVVEWAVMHQQMVPPEPMIGPDGKPMLEGPPPEGAPVGLLPPPEAEGVAAPPPDAGAAAPPPA